MSKKPKVFFNASVILSGINSPKGGSGKVLEWAKEGKIQGLVSELVVEEVLRHSKKIGVRKIDSERKIKTTFEKIHHYPENISKIYFKMVKDVGDAHLLESSKNLGVDYLVSLDKKHVLSLKGKTKHFKIVSPGELIRYLS